MLAALTSPDNSLDVDYLGNYANSTIRDRLLRIDGVGDVRIFGGGNYAMRIWIDPAKAAAELEDLLKMYPTLSNSDKNRMLKSVISRIDYAKLKKTKPRDFTLSITPLHFIW